MNKHATVKEEVVTPIGKTDSEINFNAQNKPVINWADYDVNKLNNGEYANQVRQAREVYRKTLESLDRQYSPSDKDRDIACHFAVTL